MDKLLRALNLDQLIHFHQIASHRSLVNAARRLSLTPPTLTHSLKRREAVLQTTLCLRSRSGFRLTAEGEALYARTRILVKELDGYLETLRRPAKFSGIVSLAVLDDFDQPALQEGLDRMVRRFPALRLNLMVTGAEETTRLVRQGEAEAGFGIFRKRSPELRYLTIGQSTLRLYISKAHPLWKKARITRNDLIGHRLTWVDTSRKSLQELEIKVFFAPPRPSLETGAYTNQLCGALMILKTGLAIVPLPHSYIKKLAFRNQVRELPIDPGFGDNREEAVFRADSYLSPPVRWLLAFLETPKMRRARTSLEAEEAM